MSAIQSGCNIENQLLKNELRNCSLKSVELGKVSSVGSKVFLSVVTDDYGRLDIKLRSLNIGQRLLRWMFGPLGAYSDTHLSTIFMMRQRIYPKKDKELRDILNNASSFYNYIINFGKSEDQAFMILRTNPFILNFLKSKILYGLKEKYPEIFSEILASLSIEEREKINYSLVFLRSDAAMELQSSQRLFPENPRIKLRDLTGDIIDLKKTNKDQEIYDKIRLKKEILLNNNNVFMREIRETIKEINYLIGRTQPEGQQRLVSATDSSVSQWDQQRVSLIAWKEALLLKIPRSSLTESEMQELVAAANKKSLEEGRSLSIKLFPFKVGLVLTQVFASSERFPFNVSSSLQRIEITPLEKIDMLRPLIEEAKILGLLEYITVLRCIYNNPKQYELGLKLCQSDIAKNKE